MSLNVCIYVCAFCMLSGINRRRNHVFSITSARYSRGNVTLSQFLKLAIKMLSKVRIKNINLYLIIDSLICYRWVWISLFSSLLKKLLFHIRNYFIHKIYISSSLGQHFSMYYLQIVNHYITSLKSLRYTFCIRKRRAINQSYSINENLLYPIQTIDLLNEV